MSRNKQCKRVVEGVRADLDLYLFTEQVASARIIGVENEASYFGGI